MIEFEYFGMRYITLEGNDNEVALKKGPSSGRVIIPKQVEHNGKTYVVTQIGHESRKVVGENRLKEGTGIPDNRRKDGWKVAPVYVPIRYEEIGPFNYDWIRGTYMPETSAIDSIVMPDTVNSLYDNAFRRCQKLKTIELPHKITAIPQRAFSGCILLENCTLHEGIVSIGKRAFFGCSALKEISIPSSVKTIDDNAFGDASNSLSGLEVVNIYNDEENIIIHPSAFTKRVKINYLGANNKKNVPTDNVSEERQIDLDKLIDAVVADGVVTDKERAVILKKATASGYDADEVEILLDARLYEKQAAQNKTEKHIKRQQETEKPEVKEVTKLETNESESETKFPWGEKVWEPVKASLAANNVALKAPKTNQSWIIFKLKSIDAQIVLAYNTDKNIATVQLETSSGEAVKSKIDSKIAQTAENHVIRTIEVEQGKRNKNKWFWAVRKNIDKTSPEIIKWYADVMIDIYRAIEG